MIEKPTYEILAKKVEELTETTHKLKKSQHMLRTLVDTMGGEAFIKDDSGNYLFVNEAFGNDFGVDPQEVIGKDDFFVFPPETAKRLQENDRRIMAAKKAVNVEESGIVQGKPTTYMTSKVPLLNDDGSVFGICGVGVNITEKNRLEKELQGARIGLEKRVRELETQITKRKRAEAALQDSKNKFQRLVEDLGDNFIIYSHGLDGILTYASPGIESIFGISRKETIGRDWTKLIEWEPRDLELAGENIRNMVAGTVYRRMSMSFKRVDGKKRTVFISPHPIISSAGDVVGVEGILEDITERKQMEATLENAHSELEKRVAERTAQLSETVAQLSDAKWRYRTVADFTYDWEYWVNLDGSLQYVSPSCERVSGYAPQQFLDNPVFHREIIVPEDLDIWDAHFHESRQDPGAREIQFRIQHFNGILRWIEHVCQPVIDDQGKMLGFRASNRDITKRKEGELKLQRAYSEIKALKTQLEAEHIYLREEIKIEHDYENIIGDSDPLKYVLFRIEQVAPTDTAALILGETGTGKELVARAIHNASKRKARPLIKVDCASLPAPLIESELFGHEKGAFTGAIEKRVGRFELANGATLFLDEIGELPLDLQSKLLRVLQDGEYERVGSSKTLHTDVRIIAATNRNLEKDVQEKKFRMDLWYRLSVFTISIPPLRERTEDIVLLVNHLVKQFERKHGKRIKSVATHVITKLRNYNWPGNVRELENVIERAVLNTQGDILQVEDALSAQQTKGVVPLDVPIKGLAEIEREHILRALKKTNWKINGVDGAATMLNINPNTLRGRMRKHEIERPPYKF